jgi:IclR family KDG regulon transcriptional repressor
MRLLTALAEAPSPVGVHELARAVRTTPTTAHRLLRTLVSAGIVEQDEQTGRYRMGSVVLRWADAYAASVGLRRAARPVLEHLAMQTGETVHLLVFDGQRGLYLDRVDSPQRLRVATPIGHRESLHCSAAGKALLAFLPEDVQRRILDQGLCRRTPNTITDPERLREHLAEVRQRGYAVDDGEGELGVRCVGAPILGRRGDVVGALSVAGPAARLAREDLDALAPTVREAAAQISQRLGAVGADERG